MVLNAKNSGRRKSMSPLILADQTGSVAVIVALIMTLLLSVMAFTMDAGYLYLKRNQYQNAVEATALAGVRRLCDGDWHDVALRIAEENGISGADQSLLVETGFYDARGEYAAALGDYQDYGPPPMDRYSNALRVRLIRNQDSMSGMNDTVPVVAEAVAYLERIDWASLSSEGVIRLGHDSIWENTIFFGNDRIQYPAATNASGKSYATTSFVDSELLAVGDVLTCPVKVESYGYWGGQRIEIKWDAGLPQTGDGIWPGSASINEIRPVDDDYLAYWREQANTIYTPDQAGQDNVYYGQGTGSDGGFYYFVDPGTESLSARRVIFFDAGEDAIGSVLLGPASGTAISHTPNGDMASDLVFVATCPIQVRNALPSQLGYTFHVGGQGDAQTLIVSAGDIEIFTNGVEYDGVVFRAGNDFIKNESQSSIQRTNYIRVVADGSIYGEPYSAYINDPGLFSIYVDSRFGSPCPPAMARLGRLEPADTK